MKMIKSCIVALLLLSSACNEVFGSNSETQHMEELNEQKNSPHKGISSKIAADIAANVVIYRLLPLSVTKWSYHFLFMDFYAGYTMLGVTLLSPKFLTFCNGKLRIGFGDLNIDFWRLIPLTMTFKICRKECYAEGKGLLPGLVFCVVNSIDAYFMYVQWKYIKIGIFELVSVYIAGAAHKAEDEHKNFHTWFLYPFFLANKQENTYYDGHPSSFDWLIYFPKISLNLSWNKDHENENVEDELD